MWTAIDITHYITIYGKALMNTKWLVISTLPTFLLPPHKAIKTTTAITTSTYYRVGTLVTILLE